MEHSELLALIRESFLKDEEKAEVERLLASGDEEKVLHVLQSLLEKDIDSRAERFRRAYNGLEKDLHATDTDFEVGKARLEQEIEGKLSALAENDFEARERVWEEYDKEILALEKDREEKLRAAATSAFMS